MLSSKASWVVSEWHQITPTNTEDGDIAFCMPVAVDPSLSIPMLLYAVADAILCLFPFLLFAVGLVRIGSDPDATQLIWMFETVFHF